MGCDPNNAQAYRVSTQIVWWLWSGDGLVSVIAAAVLVVLMEEVGMMMEVVACW